MDGEGAATEFLTGGCHCGAVRYRLRAPADIVVHDCNCSMCSKAGYLHLIVDRTDFELLSGGDALSEYRFNTGVARHLFCSVCGIHAHYTPRSHPDKVDVNVRCLDGDLVDAFTFVPFDGKAWEDNIHLIADEGREP